MHPGFTRDGVLRLVPWLTWRWFVGTRGCDGLGWMQGWEWRLWCGRLLRGVIGRDFRFVKIA